MTTLKRRKRSRSHKDYTALAFGKDAKTDRDRRDAKRRARVDQIARIRPLVAERDGGCRFPEAARRRWPCAGGWHMDERVPRSALRGKPPETVYSLENCMGLCAAHHAMKTRSELALVPVYPGLGASGPVAFVWRGLVVGATAPKLSVEFSEGAMLKPLTCQQLVTEGRFRQERCGRDLEWADEPRSAEALLSCAVDLEQYLSGPHQLPTCPEHGPQEVVSVTVCGALARDLG